MGKSSPKDGEAHNAKQKSHLKSTSTKYLRPGALARLRYSKAYAAKSCTGIGRKRVALVDFEITGDDVAEDKFIDPALLSPERFGFDSSSDKSTNVVLPVEPDISSFPELTEITKQDNLQRTSKIPRAGDQEAESSLETLPVELLVKIMCHLDHDHLKAVFHVSQKIRKAVIQARNLHFNFTTPVRRKQMLKTSSSNCNDHGLLSRRTSSYGDGIDDSLPPPNTPCAPKYCSRLPSIAPSDLQEITTVLFKDSEFSLKCLASSELQEPLGKTMISNRALIYEEELCEAVAQNKLH